ncbi:MAG: reverse transcriptase/maturase family protein, partial [Thermodesulfobacteriota bacterium]|nr:reverse transcriptase/maturase family protein [Thermodesulfobacteriota bacterium]
SSFEIYEPKKRNISAAVFRDRVVHHALCNIIEPIFNKSMIYDSYACRKGRGSHAAVKRTQRFTRKFSYFLKCDIKKYFENINHNLLKTMLGKKLKDPLLMELLNKIIDHPVPGGNPGIGIPIGNLTSQLFANIYLNELDLFIKEEMHIKGYVRYMDDFILFAHDKKSLNQCLNEIHWFTVEKLFIELKQSVLMLAPVTQGVPFLGFRIFPQVIRLKKENLKKFGNNLKKRKKEYETGVIDQECLIRSISSMVAHASHADTYLLRRKIFY